MLEVIGIILLGTLLVLIVAAGGAAFLICRVAVRMMLDPKPGKARRRFIVLSSVAALVVGPTIAWSALDYRAALRHVPHPLEVAEIEYRLEESWGFGPGGNETGFFIYRLTDTSAAEARQLGQSLATTLRGKQSQWHPTPVGRVRDLEDWLFEDQRVSAAKGLSQHLPSMEAYLLRYGFYIPVGKSQLKEADDALQNPGSIYSYSRGGGVTIIDTKRGKVYYGYSG